MESNTVDLERVYDFLLNSINDRMTIEGFVYEPIKMGGIYWSLTAISLLKGEVNNILHPKLNLTLEEIAVDIVARSKNANGGFGNAPGHPSTVIATHYALLILSLLNRLDIIDREATIKFISSLQNADGSFSNDTFGEADARQMYSAIVCLGLLGGLDRINIVAATKFLLACQNADGGFGWQPRIESHAAATFCCIGALTQLGLLSALNLERVALWLTQRQVAAGGFNGRPEKSADICYCWWVSSALYNIGYFDIQGGKLLDFIVSSQNEQDGGIAFFPGYMGDVFHTFFALAAMSLLDHEKYKLQKIHPLYATSLQALENFKALNFSSISNTPTCLF